MVEINADEETKNREEGETEDFEDGELPEDGEICDDDDEEDTNNQPQSTTKAASPQKDQVAAPAASSTSENPRETTRERTRRFEPTRDPDPFGGPDDAASSEFFGGNDKDYRGPTADEDGFNDFDYRSNNRRRRHSPTSEDADYDSRSKRPFRGGSYRSSNDRAGGNGNNTNGGFRNGGQKPRFNTEHQICKFFREGYCRDGDTCSYSHSAEDSLRRPVLCNFYLNSFCKKGLQCLMLHGEYPCIDFHRGHCANEQCRFSHIPLTDYTKTMFEKASSESDLRNQRQQLQQQQAAAATQYRQNPVANAAAAAVAATLPTASRRRVLLPGGPTAAPLNTSSPPHQQIIHAPVPQQSHMMGGQLPPPSIVVPTIQRAPMMHGGYFNSTMPMQQVLPPPRTIEPPRPVSQVVQQPPKPEKKSDTPTFNLEAMLNKLAKGEALEDDESPASPPPPPNPNMPTSFLSNLPTAASKTVVTKVIPANRTIVWLLMEVEKPPAYSGVTNVDRIPSNDPRKARALSEQFDAFSSLLGNNEQSSSDPRLRSSSDASSYDIGYSNSRSTPMTSWMPQMS